MLTIYKASAGSGKTYTLAYEYIKLLLGEKNRDTGKYRLRKNSMPNHRHILAITFTNKATDEMKRRIVKELAILANIYPTPSAGGYAPALTRELNCTADELTKSAAKALKSLLFDFSFFNISTIDAFFQTILRTFAVEAELSGNYEVEIENKEAIAEGVRRFFNSLSENSGDKSTMRLIKRFTRFLVSQFHEGKGVMIFNRESNTHAALIQLIASLSNESYAQHSEELTKFFLTPDLIDKFEEKIYSMSQPLQQAAQTKLSNAIAAIERVNTFVKKGTAINSTFVKSINGMATNLMKGSDYIKSITDKGADVVFNKCYKDYLAMHPDDDISTDIVDAMTAIAEYQSVEMLSKLLRSQTFYLSLMNETYKYIDEYRNENNSLLLSDTNTLIHTIIKDEETPFLYERLGLNLEHYLIDEFQDTSRLQWDNLEPLIRESLAPGNDNLIIGDEKQCIYRFRNSDPSLLQKEVENHFHGQTILRGTSPGENTNWRSSANVVSFNNSLFRALAAASGAQDIYANVDQLVSASHRDHHGFVCVRRHKPTNDADYISAAAKVLADDIERELAAGYRPCDIAVLLRGKPEGRNLMVELMRLQQERGGIRYSIVSDDLMIICQSPAVRFIISYLRSVAATSAISSENEPDDAEQARRQQRKNKSEIAAMISRYEINRSDGMSPEEAITASVQNVSRLTMPSASSVTLVDIVEDIIALMPADMRADNACYICAFQDLINDFTTGPYTDIHSFLDWWDKRGSSTIVSAPENPNAVRMMTIHKSKGLEFKCVHVPCATWEIVKFMTPEWFDTKPLSKYFGDTVIMPPLIPLRPGKKLEGTPLEKQYHELCHTRTVDELNVLYVAFTRAVDELCVQYSSDKSGFMGSVLDAALPAAFPSSSFVQDSINDCEYMCFGKPCIATTDKVTADPFAASVSFMPAYMTRSLPEEPLSIDPSPEED